MAGQEARELTERRTGASVGVSKFCNMQQKDVLHPSERSPFITACGMVRRDVHLSKLPFYPEGRAEAAAIALRGALNHRPGRRSCLCWRTQIRCTHYSTDPVQV